MLGVSDRRGSPRPARSLIALAMLLLLSFTTQLARPAVAAGEPRLIGDAFRPPARPGLSAAGDEPHPGLWQPSAFLAGQVAVQLVFVESDGSGEPSSEDWSPGQIAVIQEQVGAALDWWRERLPNAGLHFDLSASVVPSRYEPIAHSQGAEGQWIGDTLARLGYPGGNYFDQAYAADDALRRARKADWATTIFVVNSAADLDGRFADGLFAYAYLGGPFMVLTSDAGAYSTARMAQVVAHELGHIFGALDQYAAAATPCTLESGYLSVPATNSQAESCGTHFDSIMLDPTTAYPAGTVDESALGQLGYRDSDGDRLPDPLDTVPALQVAIEQPAAGRRPTLTARAVDQPYPALSETPATINTIARIEYRVNGGAWVALPAKDGAYDGAVEEVAAVLPLYDGQQIVELRAINSVGAAAPLVGQGVTVSGVGAAPAYQVDAPALSNTANISVRLGAPAGSSVQISEDPFFAGAVWAPSAPSASWRLGTPDGTHTLYVRFRANDGLESPPIARTVLLDRAAPDGRALLHAAAAPWIELHAQDSVSGVAGVQLIFGEQAVSDWQPFQQRLNLPLGTSSVLVRLRDAAGNVSDPLPAQALSAVFLPLVSAG